MTTDVQTRTKIKITPKKDLTPPPKFKVIFMNDNVTTVDFVIAVLQEIFDHNFDSAQELTVKIHEEGSAMVAVLPFEIAESKAVETTLNTTPPTAETFPIPLNAALAKSSFEKDSIAFNACAPPLMKLEEAPNCAIVN